MVTWPAHGGAPCRQQVIFKAPSAINSSAPETSNQAHSPGGMQAAKLWLNQASRQQPSLRPPPFGY